MAVFDFVCVAVSPARYGSIERNFTKKEWNGCYGAAAIDVKRGLSASGIADTDSSLINFDDTEIRCEPPKMSAKAEGQDKKKLNRQQGCFR